MMQPKTKQMAFVCLTVAMIACLFFDQFSMAGTALGGMLILVDPGSGH